MKNHLDQLSPLLGEGFHGSGAAPTTIDPLCSAIVPNQYLTLLGNSQPRSTPLKYQKLLSRLAGESCNETGNMLRFSAEGLNEEVLGTFSVQTIPLSRPEFTTQLQLPI